MREALRQVDDEFVEVTLDAILVRVTEATALGLELPDLVEGELEAGRGLLVDAVLLLPIGNALSDGSPMGTWQDGYVIDVDVDLSEVAFVRRLHRRAELFKDREEDVKDAADARDDAFRDAEAVDRLTAPRACLLVALLDERVRAWNA